LVRSRFSPPFATAKAGDWSDFPFRNPHHRIFDFAKQKTAVLEKYFDLLSVPLRPCLYARIGAAANGNGACPHIERKKPRLLQMKNRKRRNRALCGGLY